MKIMTVLGTRPEIIRLSRVIEKLDRQCEHVLVHTGQNYDFQLNEVFFQQMRVRQPDHFLGARGSLGEQIGTILSKIETLLRDEKPDRFLVLGDTNSALTTIMAKRLAIPVYHMEAGNRCYDDRVPEEVNRRIIDHSSDILMPYTERSRQNLLREGIEGQRVFVTGNPILEVIKYFDAEIQQSAILHELGLKSGEYFLVTMHRAENVDVEQRLRWLATALDQLEKTYHIPVVVSTHPHTAARLKDFGIGVDNANIRFLKPFGFFDFIHLEKNAACLCSDSGTVQEECCLFKVPNVTLRDVTERPETVECGSNLLSGAEPDAVMRCVRLVMEQKPHWEPPRDDLMENVSDTVVKVMTGFLHR